MSKVSRISQTSVDWANFIKFVPKSEKASFKSFKALCDKYQHRVSKLPQTLPKIDFSKYKESLSSSLSKEVDNLEKEYIASAVDYPQDKSKTIEKLDKVLDEQKITVANFEKKSVKAKEILKNLKATMDSMPAYREMTLEMYVSYFPSSFNPEEKPTMWPNTPEEQPEHFVLDHPDHPKWFGVPKNSPHLASMRKD